MRLIKKELLSIILGRRVVSVYNESRINDRTTGYKFQNKENPSDGGHIGLAALLIKCRRWAERQGYEIDYTKSEDGYCAGSVSKPGWHVLRGYFIAGKEEDVMFDACQFIVKDMK